MVKSLGFLFYVFAKDLYTILALIKLQRILNLSISTYTVSTKSRGNMAVDSFHSSACVGSLRNGITVKFGYSVPLFLQTLKRLFQNRFKVSVYDKGNFELVHYGTSQKSSLQACLSLLLRGLHNIQNICPWMLCC